MRKAISNLERDGSEGNSFKNVEKRRVYAKKVLVKSNGCTTLSTGLDMQKGELLFIKSIHLDGPA